MSRPARPAELNQKLDADPDEADPNDLGLSLREVVRKRVCQTEREVLMQVLKRTGGNKAKAARLLQVDYKTMRTKARQYAIPF